jgi:hypothetical protein
VNCVDCDRQIENNLTKALVLNRERQDIMDNEGRCLEEDRLVTGSEDDSGWKADLSLRLGELFRIDKKHKDRTARIARERID